ncbi:MAG: TonB-dependent receptor [Ignavibacteria bacterium]|nr:TonB-dependent receptor [Ignavibacteria bacterium]
MESGGEFSFNNIVSNETEKGELYQAALFSVSKIVVEVSRNSKVTFYPSVRYDYFSNIAERNVLTGKLGVNFQPFMNAEFHVKSSIGNNFSAPNFNELYWKDVGNKDLRPEKSISFDAGLFYKFSIIGMNEIELSYFNVNTTDRIVWTPVSGSIWRPLNIGKVKSEGIDVSLRSAYDITSKLNVAFGINYTYGSALKKNEDFTGDPSYNKQLIYLPKEMVKSSFLLNYYLTTSKILKFVSFNLFYSFNTRRFTNFENTQFIPRFDILDGNIGFGTRVLGIDTGVKFVINNIMNENYSILPGYPMPVRNYRFELSIKY